MDGYVDHFLAPMDLAPPDLEVVPLGGRSYRAVLSPAFRPQCALTVRDSGRVGEAVLVATGLRDLHALYRHPKTPERCWEAAEVPPRRLSEFRGEMDEIRPEGLGDAHDRDPAIRRRDGMIAFGEVRWDGGHHRFNAIDDREIWRDHPAHGRFFLAIWRLADDVFRDDWSRRVLDPRHFGDLTSREDGMLPPRTRRRRS